MKKINEIIKKKYDDLDERILQFGEGNFLRAFADWMIDLTNENNNSMGRVVIVQPIENGLVDLINSQNGLYTLSIKGNDKGKAKIKNRIIHSVSRAINPYENFEEYIKFAESEKLEIVISNTTEAGISYKKEEYKENEIQNTFPAKVTQLLYKRYLKFDGDKNKGLLFLPVELIDNNGYMLKKYVLQYSKEWELPEEFIKWVNECNEFASTLVDRIVTGRPKPEEREEFYKENNYIDELLVTSELFNLWVIEADESWKEKFNVLSDEANVIWTNDVSPYKKRKVRILNGGHTSTVPAAFYHGYNIVRDFMKDDIFYKYLNKMFEEEIIPTIDLDRNELINFKNEVNFRFENPYVDHKLLDITLNSISKWNARVLPSLVDYYNENNKIPKLLTFSLAALIKFYDIEKENGSYYGINENDKKYEVKDDKDNLELFVKLKESNNYLDEVLANKTLWKYDFDKLGNFKEQVKSFYEQIENKGIRTVIEGLF
ncbi:MAG: tagaturonate reductase [Tissierellia bacterium]|nr:tagaturonate reductase [Tissierellia bacterium]